MKKIALVLVALAAMFGFGSAASATTGGYPPDAPTVTVDRTASYHPGGTVVAQRDRL